MKREILTFDEAVNEASRCLKCNNPGCKKACPLSNDIPLFIEQIKNKNIEKAYEILCETSIMPEVCSIVCPVCGQCEGNCVLGIKGNSIQISKLEQFVSHNMLKDNKYLEYFNSEKIIKNKNKKVAIIGMGPAGIGAAYYLIKKGFDVTIFEKESNAGGILIYGIPEFRLSKDIVSKVVDKLVRLGVKIKYNMKLGDNLSIDGLRKDGYNAIVLCLGLTKPNKLNADGENLENILNGNDFLYQYNIHKDKEDYINNKDIVIVGGGNVAIDCARASIRLKAKTVNILYRRSINQMPVSKQEYEEAISEGVQIRYLTLPIKFTGDNKVKEVECVKIQLGDIDETGRQSPIEIENSNFKIKTDYVINCLGSNLDLDFIKDNIPNIEINNNRVETNEYGMTNISDIFIAGDMLNKTKKVAYAIHTGTLAGIGVERYLNK